MSDENRLKKKLQKDFSLPLWLTLFLWIMAIPISSLDRSAGVVAICFLLVYTVIISIIYMNNKSGLMSKLMSFALEQGKVQQELLRDLAIPYAILDISGKILWGNKKFYSLLGYSTRKRIRKNIATVFPEIYPDLFKTGDAVNVDINYNDRVYNGLIRLLDMSNVIDYVEDQEEIINSDKADIKNSVVALYLFDETEIRKYMKENAEQKMVAGLLYIDNYDEVINSLEEARHALLEALIDRKINMYLNSIDAICKKTEKDKYFFVFQQKYVEQLKETKFGILDEVRGMMLGNELPVTLSIGIGSSETGFSDSHDNAKIAIGLALGRGGDQAVVKSDDKTTYFGAKTVNAEKTTRVKARVKAHAFKEILDNKETVLIMGHARPDPDSFGAAIGIYRLVLSLNKKAHIVINEVTSSIAPVFNNFKGNSLYNDDMVINSDEAITRVDSNTLVVVVDVNKPEMTECEELLSLARAVVVFDHHRQSDETIKNATLSYVEPFASSACEMIAEMLQYINEKTKIRPIEADAMYAGILIDTDNFATKTGVRTFEAASYLKRCGADVTRVRKMFRSNMVSLKQRAEGIANAQVYLDIFAISNVAPKETDAPTVVAAKVANELLNADGIRASFVLLESEGKIFISARSVDDVNVQVIMEQMGGGGHANSAGTQIEGDTLLETEEKLKQILHDMYQEGDI